MAASSSQKKESTPSVWLSLDLPGWLRVLAGNYTRIERRKLPLAAAITIVCCLQSVAGMAERLLYGARIKRAIIEHDPVFILGHWRSGTSLLHEMLSLDRRHTTPTNYHCFCARHFLLTERFFKPVLSRFMPSKRMQDNMELDLDLPQEDEIGLGAMGAPSPYHFVAFPNEWSSDTALYEIDNFPEAQRLRWEHALLEFLKKVLLVRPGRLILKSPTHTFRAKTLVRLFPRARFIHIVRNPYSVYSSTMHLWPSICDTFSLEKPDYSGLQKFVFRMYAQAHASFAAARSCIPAGQFHEIRYEDLTRDPEEVLRGVYRAFDLPGFETELLPGLIRYRAAKAQYRKNTFSLDPESIAQINRQWGSIIERCGYTLR